jgi:hypothetical protein
MIMKAERQRKEATSRVIQPSKGGGGHIVDNRPQFVSLSGITDFVPSYKGMIGKNREMIQLKPEKTDDEGHYRDNKYTDVLFERVKVDEYTTGYKIISDKCKGMILIYDIDVPAYYTPDYKQRFEIENASSISLELESEYDAASIGRGVAFVNQDTTLKISGLITCVGWVIYNDKAAYATHIVVGDPEKVSDNNIKEQVEILKSVFEDKTKTSPNKVLIHIVDACPAYAIGKAWKSKWMQELIPSGCTPMWSRGMSSYNFFVPKDDETSLPITWTCDPITLKYNEDK